MIGFWLLTTGITIWLIEQNSRVREDIALAYTEYTKNTFTITCSVLVLSFVLDWLMRTAVGIGVNTLTSVVCIVIGLTETTLLIGEDIVFPVSVFLNVFKNVLLTKYEFPVSVVVRFTFVFMKANVIGLYIIRMEINYKDRIRGLVKSAAESLIEHTDGLHP
jgi:hypothetical protein